MTKNSFRSDLRRGLGSCYLTLERCPDIEAYREDILWACRHAVAYDTQSEGTRAIYVHDLMEFFDDPSYFFPVLSDGAKHDIKDPGWRFAHETDILALMAGDGYDPAWMLLEELYGLLLGALRTGRPCRSGIWPALDNFSALSASILSNAVMLQKQAEDFFLQVMADYGRLIRQRPELRDRFDDGWFEDVAADCFGEELLGELLKFGADDPDIALYLENRDRLAAERRAYQAGLKRDAVPAAKRPREREQTADARDRTIDRLKADPKDADALCSLIANFQPGDGEMLISLVKSLPVYEAQGDWHAVFWEIRELIASDPSADRELSAALLPYIYRKGFCSECRMETVELMAARGLLTPELLEECRYDCNVEIRIFAEDLYRSRDREEIP